MGDILHERLTNTNTSRRTSIELLGTLMFFLFDALVGNNVSRTVIERDLIMALNYNVFIRSQSLIRTMASISTAVSRGKELVPMAERA